MKRALIGTLVLLGVTCSSAFANGCEDAAWTNAITEAMGRPPKAGECNVNLYGEARTQEERVRAVRETLTHIYRDCQKTDNVPTQKLPLRRCDQRPAGKAGAGT